MSTTVTVKEYLEDHNAFYLVDVRTPSEYEEAHIQGSHSHPLDTMRMEEIISKSQGRKILLSCLSGARAQRAAKQFIAAGHSVCCLEGSIQGWEKEDQPVVRSVPKGLPLIRQVHLTISVINMAAAVMVLLVSKEWAWVIVGTSTGLFLAGATGFCGLGLLLAKMPWNRPRASASSAEKETSCDTGG